jgi:hypothetical protein
MELEAMAAQLRNADALEMRSQLEQESAKKKAKLRKNGQAAKAAAALNTSSASKISVFDSSSDTEELYD